MQKTATTAAEISEYFTRSGETANDASHVLAAIISELSVSDQFVSNKAIILKLLEKLEVETDAVTLDIYRQALEMVVQRTPDDIIS